MQIQSLDMALTAPQGQRIMLISTSSKEPEVTNSMPVTGK